MSWAGSLVLHDVPADVRELTVAQFTSAARLGLPG